MIKKVPKSHLVQYLLNDRQEKEEENHIITTEELCAILKDKFKHFKEKRCEKLAMFLTQEDGDGCETLKNS